LIGGAHGVILVVICKNVLTLDGASMNPDNVKSQTVYRCHVCLIPEDDGTFSAVVLNLPGAGSCGDTKEKAIENVREAILGVIASHREHGEEIPWKDARPGDIPAEGTSKWILVNAE
jgi:predicted RNase H-like HicB family nuclease